MNWKKIVGFCPCWACFWVGHWVSKPFEHFDRLAFLYPVYNTLMCWSLSINDWAGLDAWRAPEHPRLRDMARNYADMLYETGREEELKKASWLVPSTQEINWGFSFSDAVYREIDPSKVLPELEKKMRRELIAYKRQKER
ncbi:hypothetical protein LCGC14_2009910 [marine sediment metagenome]|uniref:Uncharacterized protein n=1 Tax=marine sediment metagenome TaxID=412755 RepID=A0A0F9FN51_9ZZZZ